MSLKRRIERARETPPLAERLAARHFRAEKPVDPTLSELQIANRIEPLLGHIAAGDLPLNDPRIAAGAGRAVERIAQQQEEGD